MREAPRHHAGLAVLSLGALGIVFGDIGTSPLYALQTVFAADQHAVQPTQSGVYGVISLVFWAITLIVSVKYVALIMRADNEGEGGIMALIALIREKGLQRRFAQVALVALGIFGASLFYGDGMITPAISVLSAVEGIEVVEPGLHVARGADHARDPRGPVRDPALRHRRGRPLVRADHDRLVHAAGDRRAARGAQGPGDPARDLAELRAQLHVRARARRVHRARLGRADRHRRGGALRGHGPLRPPSDPARVVHRGVPRPDPQLHGPGRADPPQPEGDRQPVLPADPALGPDPDDRARHRRDGDRLAGGDLGRVLGHAPGGPARLPPAPDDPPHLARGRPGLRAGRQLGDLRGGRGARGRVRLLPAPRRRLRHRGDRHAGDRHGAVLRRRPHRVGQAEARSRCRARSRS